MQARHLVLAFAGALLSGCGPDNNGEAGRNDLSGQPADLSGDLTPPCVNLQCQQQACSGAPTKITGKVVAPALGDPVPGVVVYVPNGTVTPFAAGVQCETCGAPLSGAPLVQATTGTDGSFSLENVPVGSNIPLVIQSGHWRRQVVMPTVTACVDNPLPADLGRLPHDHNEGEIPKMALVMGDQDPLECTLTKLIDPAEITAPSGSGRIHLYRDSGNDLSPAAPPRSALIDDLATLKQYDAVMLPCGGHSAYSEAEAANLKAYVDQGGRVFNTHGGGYWLFEPTARFGNVAVFNNQPDPGNSLAYLDTGFAKGMTFAMWLQLIGVSTTFGQMPISGVQWFVDSVMAPAQRWVYTQGPTTIQHFTFNTPVTVPETQQCGRVLFSNFHVGSASAVGMFPTVCVPGALSSNEKIIEYMLFDVTACVQPDIL